MRRCCVALIERRHRAELRGLLAKVRATVAGFTNRALDRTPDEAWMGFAATPVAGAGHGERYA